MIVLHGHDSASCYGIPAGDVYATSLTKLLLPSSGKALPFIRRGIIR
jgi:hypothetical protein